MKESNHSILEQSKVALIPILTFISKKIRRMKIILYVIELERVS